MKRLKKLLSVVLSVCMIAGMAFAMPTTASATGAEETDGSRNSDSQYRIVHLDAGRKYFSVDSIKKIIDTMAAADTIIWNWQSEMTA